MTKSIHLRRLESRVARTAARFVAHSEANGLAVADLPSVRLPWFEIRNRADEPDGPGDATVFVFDEIGGSFGVSAEDFARELEMITAPVIKVRINSPGGSVFDSITIYNALNHHRAKIVTYVDGLAASGASIIAMAGDEIVMMPGSQMMIHDAAALEEGNARDMAAMSTFLDRQSDNVADIYQQRAGGDVAEWRELMLAETWLFAREAVAFGLADRVETPPAREAGDVEERMSRSFDLAGYRYAGRDQAPTPARRDAIAAPARTTPREMPPARPAAVSRDHAPAPALDDHFLEQLGRVAAERRDNIRARGDRPSQRRCAADKQARAYMHAKCDMSLTAAADGSPGRLEFRGLASAYERRYEMWDSFGPYLEVVSAGAGEQSLARPDLDVPLVLDHASIRRIARTTNGTLLLSESDFGLEVVAPELDETDADVAYIRPKIDAKLIDEMSFRFMISAGQWSADFTEYRINAYDIHRGDTAIVGYGANPYTHGTMANRQAASPNRLAMRLALAIAD